MPVFLSLPGVHLAQTSCLEIPNESWPLHGADREPHSSRCCWQWRTAGKILLDHNRLCILCNNKRLSRMNQDKHQHKAFACTQSSTVLSLQISLIGTNVYTSFVGFGEATRQLSRTHSHPQRKVNEIRSALLNAVKKKKINFLLTLKRHRFRTFCSLCLCSACSALERNWRNSLLISWWALWGFNCKSGTPP